MHLPRSLSLLTLASLSLSTASAYNLDCTNIQLDGVKFNIDLLGGLHHLYKIDNSTTSTYTNTTFTFDLCRPIKDSSQPKGDRCEHGTRVCAAERHYRKEGQEGEPPIDNIWPIAGEFTVGGSGKSLDAKTERIGKSTSNEDQKQGRDGVRIIFNGGEKPNDDETMPQRAIIELICDPAVTGLEGEAPAEEDEESIKDDEPPAETKSPLQLVGYKIEQPDKDNKDYGVLRAEWRTKYACEGEAGRDHSNDPQGGSSSSSWGIFTWFIIILFLGVATYLIFGSWLNYSRHGARGWDLLPHGDTIRDVPYIVRDLGRRVVSTVQGGGRGGYNQI